MADYTNVVLYPDANNSFEADCIKLGDITEYATNQNHAISMYSASGVDFLHYGSDDALDIAWPLGISKAINEYDFSGTDKSLYANPHLRDGFTLSEYSGATSKYHYLTFFVNQSTLGGFRVVSISSPIDYASRVYPAVAKINGTMRFGFYVVCTNSDSYFYQRWDFISFESFSDKFINDVDYLDPGDEGFEPTDDINNGKSIGGRGKGSGGGHSKRPDWKTDIITNPDAPDETDASVANSGFLNVYKVNRTNLKKLGECLFGSTMEGFLTNMLLNPIDYVVSINLFPCNPETDFSESIKLGRWDCVANVLDADAVGYPLQAQFKVIHFGTLQIGENWGSFLDYAGTTIQLYLPFIGVVDIDVNEVMNGSITVDYTIDFYTGMCVANVLCTKTINTPTKYGTAHYNTVQTYAQHSYQGNCAVQIPITAASYGGIVGSITGAIGSACAGNGGGAISGLVNAAETYFKPPITTKGSLTANGGFCSILYPYISITRPITNIPESYQETVGYPSYVDGSLSACKGLCVCDSINLKSVSGATDSELQRIESMCKQGVYV